MDFAYSVVLIALILNVDSFIQTLITSLDWNCDSVTYFLFTSISGSIIWIGKKQVEKNGRKLTKLNSLTGSLNIFILLWYLILLFFLTLHCWKNSSISIMSLKSPLFSILLFFSIILFVNSEYQIAESQRKRPLTGQTLLMVGLGELIIGGLHICYGDIFM